MMPLAYEFQYSDTSVQYSDTSVRILELLPYCHGVLYTQYYNANLEYDAAGNNDLSHLSFKIK